MTLGIAISHQRDGLKPILASAALLILLPLPAMADVVGRVEAVVDGDTVIVLVNGHDRIQVRLAGIDAPERQQNFGRQSQNHLSMLTFGKEVQLEGDQKDYRGHTVAKLWVSDPACQRLACPRTVDAGLSQVEAGLAWHDRQGEKSQSVSDRQRYAQAEFLAKVRRQGLWSESNPLPPWAWRKPRLDE